VLSASTPGSPTASASVTLKGTTEPGASVALFPTADCSGTPVGSGTADASGAFHLRAELSPNAASTFYARATDAAGNTSHCSAEPLTVLHDGVAPGAPVLERLTPGPLSRSPQARLEGVAEPRSTISLYADAGCVDALTASTTADERGAFRLDVSVALNSTSTFRARSTDAVGNVSPCSPVGLRFTHDDTPPPAPRFLGPTAPSVSTSQDAVGEAEPGAQVKLFSQADCTGDVLAEGAVRPEGTFSLRFELRPNSTATLSAQAVDGVGNTSACSGPLPVAHDTYSPNTPELLSTEPYSPSRTSVTPFVEGSTERGATVHIYRDTATCEASAASRVFTGTVDAQGRFRVPIEVQANTRTQLSVRASDAAGNTSGCSRTVEYVHDSLPPAPPTLISPMEPLPSYSNRLQFLGTAEPGARIRLHTDATCSAASFVLENPSWVEHSGTLGDFSMDYTPRKPGPQVYYATATDLAGNTSACSSSSLEYTPFVSMSVPHWRGSSIPYHSSEPALSQNSTNQALLLWYGNQMNSEPSRVRAALQGVDMTWTGPVVLSDEAEGAVSDVRGALSDTGEAFALWVASPASGSARLRVRRYVPVGEWGPTQTLSGDALLASAPALGVDASGNALALWLEASAQEPGRRTLRVSRFTSDTGWSAPRSLVAASTALNPHSLRLSVSRGGHAWALWTQGTGTEESLWLSRATPSGDWSAPERLDVPVLGSQPATYAFGADEQGGAVLAWLERGASPEARHVKVRRYVAGEGWSAPHVLSSVESPPSPLQVAVNARGEALVGWVHPPVDGLAQTVRVARFTPKTQWSEPAPVQSSGPFFAATSGESVWLTLDDTGAGLVVWLQSFGARNLELPPAERRQSLWSSRFEPASGWSRPQITSRWSSTAEAFTTVLLRMNGRGDTRVYWRARLGSNSTELGFRDYR
jgi:hypothetical protein